MGGGSRFGDLFPDPAAGPGAATNSGPFVPSTEWQTVAPGTPIPPGAEVVMDLNGPPDASWVRWTPEALHRLGLEPGASAGPPDDHHDARAGFVAGVAVRVRAGDRAGAVGRITKINTSAIDPKARAYVVVFDEGAGGSGEGGDTIYSASQLELLPGAAGEAGGRG